MKNDSKQSWGTMPVYFFYFTMKKSRIILVFIILILNCYDSAAAQTIDTIAELQSSRSLVDGKLYGYLRSSDPSERSRAAIALANIQDSSSIQFLLPLLNDPFPVFAVVRHSLLVK